MKKIKDSMGNSCIVFAFLSDGYTKLSCYIRCDDMSEEWLNFLTGEY